MSRTNPDKAVAAILPLPITVYPGSAENSNTQTPKNSNTIPPIVIQPMTLGMYAALERIGSPMVTGAEPKDTLELIPSLYLVTHDPREVFRGNILDLAMQWAQTVPVAVVDLVKKAFYRQLSTMTDVIPELSPEDLKKNGAETTDGSPTTRPTRQRHSAGRSKKSCGTSRPRQSRSSSASRTATSATPSR